MCENINEGFHDFAFKANIRPNLISTSESLLADCGATTHIVTEKSRFSKFDKHFESTNHTIVLADGSKTYGIVLGKGVASAKLYDTQGEAHRVELRKALYTVYLLISKVYFLLRRLLKEYFLQTMQNYKLQMVQILVFKLVINCIF